MTAGLDDRKAKSFRGGEKYGASGFGEAEGQGKPIAQISTRERGNLRIRLVNGADSVWMCYDPSLNPTTIQFDLI